MYIINIKLKTFNRKKKKKKKLLEFENDAV